MARANNSVANDRDTEWPLDGVGAIVVGATLPSCARSMNRLVVDLPTTDRYSVSALDIVAVASRRRRPLGLSAGVRTWYCVSPSFTWAVNSLRAEFGFGNWKEPNTSRSPSVEANVMVTVGSKGSTGTETY